jgi:hypothetical protein
VEDDTKAKLLVLFVPASGSVLAELKFPKGCEVESTKARGSVLAEVVNEKTESPLNYQTRKNKPNPGTQIPGDPARFHMVNKGGVGKEVEINRLKFSVS